ncbi:MAG: heat-inducible transcription repressor HrcA [Thermoleophilia bacterium]|nr:heat-inducible transcription repressor HrcA [Thermoleophilia bacterium]
MLTARQEKILGIVVDAYTRSGAPVGSRAIAERDDVPWAASTVRNEFAVLVSQGLLEQPHTSAGRRPTEPGYRYFVDGLLAERADWRDAPTTIELRFDGRETAVAIRQTTDSLAEATELMALISAPPLSTEEILRIELIRLQPREVVVVVITTSGNVTKRQFKFDREIDHGLAEWATGYLNEVLKGVPLGARMIRSRLFAPDLPVTEHSFIQAISTAFLEPPAGDETLFVGGAGHLVAGRGETAIPGLDRLMTAVEERAAVTRLLRARLDERGVYLRIGHENEAVELSGVSVVGANYGTLTRNLGSVNVIGPVRMDYPLAIASVRYAAARLSDFIADTYE